MRHTLLRAATHSVRLLYGEHAGEWAALIDANMCELARVLEHLIALRV